MPDEEMVRLGLTNAQALVLFEWLVRSDEKLASTFEDQAEQRVLWDIEAMLERTLTAPLDPNYAELLTTARHRVRDSAIDV